MQLRDKLREDMQIRNHSENTIRHYISLVGGFFEWFGKPPSQAARDDVRDFLLYMINDKGVVAGTYGQYRTALKFFFEITMGKPCVIERILTPKRAHPLPDVMSLDEVLTLLEAVQSYRNRVTLTVMYGAGLRITEACALSVGDIDSERMVIHVRNGKGRKDRYVMLPQMVLSLLRKYWRMAKPKDYLFPGMKQGRHITPQNIRREFHKARRRAGLPSRYHPHTLRHSFATHLVDAGVDLEVVQALLGHTCISTTSIYARTSTKRIREVKSPLDAEPDDKSPDDGAPVPV
ncbi:MAG: site-specific tyrosine recombinase/integron integrase [Phycisphaerae bacterium]|jgi:site-specific recombinase XerD